MASQCPFNDQALVNYPCGVQTRARTGQLRSGQTQKRTGQGSGASRIANAHFAADKQVRAIDRGPFSGVVTGLQRLMQLLYGHCRIVDKINRAGTDPRIQYARQIFQRF